MYNHYKKIIEESGLGTPCVYDNANGERVIINQGRDKETDTHFIRLECLQDNGWIRYNDYWEDGTSEEYYDK